MAAPSDPPRSADPLKPEDRRVWERVTRTVRPKGAPATFAGDRTDLMRVSPPRAGGKVRRATLPLDLATGKAVRRGRVRPEARIDLHDLTLVEAHAALERGLLRSRARAHRVVLVITGKGRRDGRGEFSGKLRTALPDWLASPDLRGAVASYAPAHIRHGGEGAWYVFLRRRPEMGP